MGVGGCVCVCDAMGVTHTGVQSRGTLTKVTTSGSYRKYRQPLVLAILLRLPGAAAVIVLCLVTRQKKLQKRIINAFAAAVPTVSRSLHASRVSQIISVAIQKSVAYNALDFRYTTLAKSYVPGLVPLAAAASVTTGDGDDDSSDDDDGDDSVAGE